MSAASIELVAISDDPAELHTLEQAVHSAVPGTTVLGFSAAAVARGLADHIDPDLIMLDELADGECSQLCQRLRADDRFADTPIVLLTRPTTTAACRAAALAAGIDGFLARPLDSAELVAQVRSMARLKAANRMQHKLAAERDDLRASRATLDTILNTVPQSIFWKDAEGRYLGCNQVFATAAGLAHPAQIIGKTDFDLPWHPADTISYRADDRSVLESNRARLHISERLRTADEKWHWIDTCKVPLVDEAGQPYAVLGIFDDITERRQLIHTLDKFFDQPMNLHIIARLDATIVRVNSGWEHLLGYTKDELEGASFMDLIHPDDRAATVAEMSRLSAGASTFYFENRYRARNGEYRVLAWSALASVEDALVYAVASDITDRKAAEDALKESEARNRLLLELAPVAILVHVEGNLVYANPACAQLLGAASAAELVGKPVTEFVHPDYLDVVRTAIQAMVAGTQTLAHLEEVYLKLDGTPIDVEVIAVPLQFQGKLAIQAIVRNITERKRADADRERLLAQLQARARLIRQILNTVPEGVLLLDQDARILMANPTAERDLATLAGVAPGDYLTHLGDLPIADLLDSAPGGPWHEIHTDRHIYEAIARPLAAAQLDHTGEHWVIVINNATQERALRAQLQQQERLAAVGQLAAGIAHDFNNILAIIALQGAMAAQTPLLPESVETRLKVITDQAAQATRLIQQMLDFSRRAVLELHPLDLLALLRDEVALLTRTLPEHIAVFLEAGNADFVVMADSTRLQQMIVNLAVNARDAMPRGGTLRLTLALQDRPPQPNLPAGSWIRLTVADTGTGMAPEAMAHLFEPFFTTKERGRGTGLGLAQVYGIVKQHSGEITVESVAGQGTTITIYLPAIAIATETAAETAGAPPSGSGATILLVEDNALLLEAMNDILVMLGYNVVCADNGKHALDALDADASTVDLILTDLIMPQMGGDALLARVRERGLQIPVVILSGHPLEAELGDLRARGLAGWLLKPPRIEDLAQVIAGALAH